MTNEKIITKKITGNLKASVISASSTTNLDQPVWAINWFDLKRGWMYDLYNRLVFSHVKGAGAIPIFKGKLVKPILNSERLRRDLLLIVKYPKASAFLAMISSKAFQIKGLLRSSSVKHFQFGFMQKENPGEEKLKSTKYEGKLKYLVHVCEGSTPIDFEALISFAVTKEVFPHFVGGKSAILGLQKSNTKLKTLDFVLTHVYVFSGFDIETLEAFTNSAFYQEIIQSSKSNFIGIYDRKI